MRKITLIILILSSNLLFSQGKTSAVKAVIKASTNKTVEIVVKKTAKETGVVFANKFLKNKLAIQAAKFSDADFITYFRNIGYSKGNATKLIKELGKEQAIKLYSLIDPSIAKGKKVLFIENYKRSPDIIETIFSNKSLKDAYSKCIGMSEAFRLDFDFLNQVSRGVSPIILTPKQNLYSKVGLVNNAMFVEKVVTLSNGLKVKGVFLKAPFIYQKRLPVDQFLRNDAANYNYAFRHFQNNLSNNPQLQKQFSKEQVNEMLNRSCKSVKKSKKCGMIPGYIWHHSEDGFIQLVKDSDHNVKHLGLRALEGGGRYLRESTLY